MAFRRTNLKEIDRIPIPGGLNKNSQIVIRGRVPFNSCRFAINLKTGEEDDADIAFHFNPRNDGDVVVHNTRISGEWGEEERWSKRFPFNNGKKFTIRIVTLNTHYRVLVNNSHFICYNHRIPAEDVRYIQLTDGADYYEVSVQNDCRQPFFTHFPDGLTVGQTIRIRGMVKDDADRIVVNFKCDRNADNIGLHFNPRPDEEVVVCNDKKNGEWGDEERDHFGQFCFHRGDYFDAYFVVMDDRFKITVNEKPFTKFLHRCDPMEIRHLAIRGDVELMDVELLEPLPNDFLKAIPDGLEKNDLIIVKGFFHGERFAINFIKGDCLDNDIALHFNPRRDDDEIVLNSKECGNWENEERHPLPRSMERLLPFEVKVIVKPKKFKIFINNRKICKFRTRDDIEDIKSINVAGEAWMYGVKLLRKVDEPFTDDVPLTLKPGNWMELSGCPCDDIERFAINLSCGPSPDDDIAFHFNPRFNVGVVVRNTRQGGAWGTEEQHQSSFPFDHDDQFDLLCVFLQHGVRTYVNGKRFIDYNYRVDLDTISHVFLSDGCDYFEPEFY